MARVRCLGALLVVLGLLTSRPARAQDLSDWAEESAKIQRTASAIGLVYVVGGSATFLVMDLAFLGQKKALPLELAVPQLVYSWTLLIAGTLAAAQGDAAWGAGLLTAGTTVGALPILHFATRRAANQPPDGTPSHTDRADLLRHFLSVPSAARPSRKRHSPGPTPAPCSSTTVIIRRR